MTDTTIITRSDMASSNAPAPTGVPAWLSPGAAAESTSTTSWVDTAAACGDCHRLVICRCRQRDLQADARREARVWYALGASALVAISYAVFQFLNSR